METLTIEFQPSIKAKILEMLHSFPSNELRIVHVDPNYAANKKMLDAELEKINNGTAVLYTIEELDAILEETISKYES